MDYRMIIDDSSRQYQLIYSDQIYILENGLLSTSNDPNIEGYIGVALGSTYGAIGTKYTVTTDNGNTFKVIKVDEKSDQHTTNGCQDQSGAMIEFVVDTNLMNQDVKFHGSYEYEQQFSGTIKKMIKENI